MFMEGPKMEGPSKMRSRVSGSIMTPRPCCVECTSMPWRGRCTSNKIVPPRSMGPGRDACQA